MEQKTIVLTIITTRKTQTTIFTVSKNNGRRRRTRPAVLKAQCDNFSAKSGTPTNKKRPRFPYPILLVWEIFLKILDYGENIMI